jgi:ubiquinone/menaquinone biosynthesis C-methylase UbiE
LQDDFSIVAADLNEDMLRIAPARCKRVSFVPADMVSFELAGNSMWYCVCSARSAMCAPARA